MPQILEWIEWPYHTIVSAILFIHLHATDAELRDTETSCQPHGV